MENKSLGKEPQLNQQESAAEKRRISDLIPYKVRADKVFVYLQKRAEDIKRNPGKFGFFGGGAEKDENPEEALKREIKEEMDFVLREFTHFKKYEFEDQVKDVFLAEVADDFDKKVKILESEGEYGKWFDERVLSEPKLIEVDRVVLLDFFEFLRKQKKA